jgi:hypothetical protein
MAPRLPAANCGALFSTGPNRHAVPLPPDERRKMERRNHRLDAELVGYPPANFLSTYLKALGFLAEASLMLWLALWA